MRARELGPALRQRIAELTLRLRREHDEFEQAAQSWTPEAEEKKREARKAREGTLQEIEELLARNGQSDRLTSIERLPFAGKLAELEALIARRPAVQESAALASGPVSEVVSVAPVVAAAPAPGRAPARERKPQLAEAKPVAPRIPSPISDPPPDASAAVEHSKLPVIHLPAYKRRRWIVAGVTTTVALVALVLAIGGRQLSRPRIAPTVDEMLPLADHTPAMLVAFAPASRDPAAGAKPSPYASSDVQAFPPCVGRLAPPRPTTQAVSPPQPAAQPKPRRLGWPSAHRSEGSR